ncbi:MAG: dihydrolipoamide acetyltransferase family protein [Planctomycetota bacterium]|jgi:pyruvate dehydrogenase E2 component (dihydrolipoamide acetyltransferase)
MGTEVRLPKLGETMEVACVIAFGFDVGDKVKSGDVLYEIETDKAAMEVESPADGVVKHIFPRVGQVLAVGEPIMILGAEEEQIPQELLDSLKSQIANHSEKVEDDAPDNGVQVLPDREAIDPEQIKLGGSIPITRLQKITAERMLRSKQKKPTFYLNIKADVTDLVEFRSNLNENADVKISYNDFIIKAVALACEKFPIITGRLKDDNIILPEKINIGLAVSVPMGLVVPVVKDVANKNISRISSDTKALIEKARENKLQLTDLEGACITVSNLGDFGVDSFIPIVIPGQASIIGVGRITETCLADYGDIIIRKMMSLTISADHKIVNGAYAGQFLDYVKKTLEDTKSFK